MPAGPKPSFMACATRRFAQKCDLLLRRAEVAQNWRVWDKETEGDKQPSCGRHFQRTGQIKSKGKWNMSQHTLRKPQMVKIMLVDSLLIPNTWQLFNIKSKKKHFYSWFLFIFCNINCWFPGQRLMLFGGQRCGKVWEPLWFKLLRHRDTKSQIIFLILSFWVATKHWKYSPKCLKEGRANPCTFRTKKKYSA